MSKKNNIIEINGHRYDAATGAKLSGHDAPAVQKPAIAPAHKPKAVKAAAPASRVARQPARHSAPRKPAPSRTLMRQAVKKPAASLKREHKVQGEVGVLVPESVTQMMLSRPADKLNEKRLKHAKQISRSHLISHFPPSSAEQAAPYVPPETKTGSQVQPPAAKMAPAPALPAGKPKTTAELLDRAVERATSHLQPPPAKRRHARLKRNAAAGAAVALSVLVLSVIVFQNRADVRLQMASAKAGFNVSLPGYKPNGYALGQINYGDGVAAAQFQNNNSNYTVIQKRTTWDSLALRDNFIAPSYQNYQTVLANNRTIYLYGNHNATWAEGGIWYIIQTDGSLSDRQLINLAASF